MPKALAIVAHHDDHVLWMGGTIQRLAAHGWHWTVIALCVPDPTRREYFFHCCSVLGAVPRAMRFEDHMVGDEFSRNNRAEMRSSLAEAVQDQRFDLVFTHSRAENGEYWARHANHIEARELAGELVDSNGNGRSTLAYFAYDVIYGSGTATCAQADAPYVLPLNYSELLWKCQLSQLAPDADASLRNLVFPCPNPEAFEGDGLELPTPPFVKRRS